MARSNPKRKKRGNVYDRHSRNKWLRSPEAGFGGNGETVPCTMCGTVLTEKTVEADRILAGDSYAHWNIRPACRPCNASRGNKPVNVEIAALLDDPSVPYEDIQALVHAQYMERTGQFSLIAS